MKYNIFLASSQTQIRVKHVITETLRTGNIIMGLIRKAMKERRNNHNNYNYKPVQTEPNTKLYNRHLP